MVAKIRNLYRTCRVLSDFFYVTMEKFSKECFYENCTHSLLQKKYKFYKKGITELTFLCKF